MTPMESLGARIAEGVSVGILREARTVGVVGSRDYPELDRVRRLIDQLHPQVCVVSGGARGVDREAVMHAKGTGRLAVEITPYGDSREEWVSAAFARNGMIALVSDVVVAFWDGQSPGTADTIRRAMKLGKCIVVPPQEGPQVWEMVP